MIFSNPKDLVNFVLHNYPYQKIITYSIDTRCPWSFSRNGRSYGKYPDKHDIKEHLVIELSRFLYYRCFDTKKIKCGSIEERLYNLFKTHGQIITQSYFDIGFSEDKKTLWISYTYRFSGMLFSKYSLPPEHYKWENKRTLVKFKFNEQII